MNKYNKNGLSDKEVIKSKEKVPISFIDFI